MKNQLPRRSSLLLLVLPLLGQAQTKEDGCITSLKAVLENVRRSVEEAPSKAMQSEVEITTTHTGDPKGSSTETLQQSSAKGRNATDNEYFSLFEDMEHRVLVMHKSKEILIYDQIGDPAPPTFDRWTKHHERLFSVGELSSCRRVKTATEVRLEVTLSLPPGDPSGLQSITYGVDTDRDRILFLRALFQPGQPYRAQTLTYRSLKPGKLDVRLARPALAQVLSNGRILPKFSHHKITDLRKKTIRHVD